MYYPDEIVEEVRSRNDIVDIMSGYRKRGATISGSAPFTMRSPRPFPCPRESRCITALAAGPAGT